MTYNEFREFFIGRNDAYGKYYIDKHGNVKTTVIKEPITDFILKIHFSKYFTIGSFCAYKLNNIWCCKWICIDFDIHDVEIIDSIKQKFNQLSLKVKKALLERYSIGHNVICREFSGRGYHLWIKLKTLTTLKRAYEFREDVRKFLKEKFDLDEEIFPKQAFIEKNGYGNWVKLPLSINFKNGEFCEILDGFDLFKQGSGYEIPIWILKLENEKRRNTGNTIVKKDKTDKKQEQIHVNNQVFKWFLDRIRPCLKAIALGKSITHGRKKDSGHLMNISLCNALLYIGAPNDIILKAFEKQPDFDREKTCYYAEKLRRGFRCRYATMLRCRTIEKRGFCLKTKHFCSLEDIEAYKKEYTEQDLALTMV